MENYNSSFRRNASLWVALPGYQRTLFPKMCWGIYTPGCCQAPTSIGVIFSRSQLLTWLCTLVTVHKTGKGAQSFSARKANSQR